jgi:hypothetical protein
MDNQKPPLLKLFGASFVTRVLYLKPSELIIGFMGCALMITGLIIWLFQQNNLLFLVIAAGFIIGMIPVFKSPLICPRCGHREIDKSRARWQCKNCHWLTPAIGKDNR